MNLFFVIMSCISFFMMMVQNNYKEKFPYACCYIFSMLVIGVYETIQLFLA